MELKTLSENPTVGLAVSAAVVLLFSLLILTGKCDFLIAGYNTASKEKKAQYNMKRLRPIVATIGLLGALLCILLIYFIEYATALTIGFVVLTIIGLVLMNTWAKKS